MIISTFTDIQGDKMKVSLVNQPSSVGHISITLGGINSVYMTWDEVLFLVQRLDELLAVKNGAEQLSTIEGEA